MAKYLNLFLPIVISMFVIPLMAAEKVKVDKLTLKTLPAEVYPLLQKGNNLSLFWKGPEFVPGRGFQVGEIAWKAENRVSEVLTTLSNQIGGIASPGGSYKLEMAITDARAGVNGMMSNTAGFYVLEGQVKDRDGKVVAAFVSKEESQWVGMEYTLKGGVEHSISGIASELFK